FGVVCCCCCCGPVCGCVLCWASLLGRTTEPAAFGGRGVADGGGGFCADTTPAAKKTRPHKINIPTCSLILITILCLFYRSVAPRCLVCEGRLLLQLR